MRWQDNVVNCLPLHDGCGGGGDKLQGTARRAPPSMPEERKSMQIG
jgi:hypothetical protein